MTHTECCTSVFTIQRYNVSLEPNAASAEFILFQAILLNTQNQSPNVNHAQTIPIP